jgi:RNA polymerase sigma factor (sigma-70 family)
LLRLRSDEQLVALFRQGSDDAFRVIHDRYRARLFAYARQMLGGSRSDAEDALQDVFLRAYNALRMDERPVVLKAWLYRVAHNRCIDHLRRPTPAASEVFEMSRTPIPDPLAEAERRDDLRRLVADVQRLPEQQRSALLMREMEGLSYADLAQALDTSIPAVKSLLVRARIGLVEAAEARNTACSEIRTDLALSFGKGVRASALARKHMRECQGCADYRKDLRAVQHGLTALNPGAHPLGLFAKLLGLSAGGGGAAAGGTAAAGGGAAIAGGGVVAGTTAKVAAVVCCAALTAGGAAEIKKHTNLVSGDAPKARAAEASQRTQAAASATPAPAALRPERAAVPAAAVAATRARAKSAAAADAARKAAAISATPVLAEEEVISPHVEDATAVGLVPADAVSEPLTGGMLAPMEDEPAPAAAEPTSAPAAAPADQQAAAGPSAPADPAHSGTQPAPGDTTAVSASAPSGSQPAGTAPSGG